MTNTKMMLAEILTENDNHSGHFESECFKFGSTWGCRIDCPVFERGECEMQEENEELFANKAEGDK